MRVILSRLAAALAVASLCSCAAPHVAPRFDVPSTASIAQANTAAQGHIQSARKQTAVIQKACPKAAAQIAALNAHLYGALSELRTSEGARIQLDTKLKEKTAEANKLADNYDKVIRDKEKISGQLQRASKALWWYRLHWWGAWIMFGLGLLACGVFAFFKFTGRLAVVAAKVGI